MSRLTGTWRRAAPGIGALVWVSLGWLTTPAAQQATGATPPPTHGVQPGRLLIKDGIPYHVPTLLDEVRRMVTRARASAGPATTAAH